MMKAHMLIGAAPVSVPDPVVLPNPEPVTAPAQLPCWEGAF
uniref:Lymphocyte antigen-6 G5B splicing isoform 284 n=1 Tax=Bos taurus TaxID=9913 RepID=N0E668_BOVIN|nr:lymphocyte antigen-6 G5B splicing isoform 284 [Bos taurus]